MFRKKEKRKREKEARDGKQKNTSTAARSLQSFARSFTSRDYIYTCIYLCERTIAFSFQQIPLI